MPKNSVLQRPKRKGSLPRNGFDRGYETKFNLSAGLLVPVFCEPVLNILDVLCSIIFVRGRKTFQNRIDTSQMIFFDVVTQKNQTSTKAVILQEETAESFIIWSRHFAKPFVIRTVSNIKGVSISQTSRHFSRLNYHS